MREGEHLRLVSKDSASKLCRNPMDEHSLDGNNSTMIKFPHDTHHCYNQVRYLLSRAVSHAKAFSGQGKNTNAIIKTPFGFHFEDEEDGLC